MASDSNCQSGRGRQAVSHVITTRLPSSGRAKGFQAESELLWTIEVALPEATRTVKLSPEGQEGSVMLSTEKMMGQAGGGGGQTHKPLAYTVRESLGTIWACRAHPGEASLCPLSSLEK